MCGFSKISRISTSPIVDELCYEEAQKRWNLKRDNEKKRKRLAARSIRTQEMLHSIKRNTGVLEVYN